MLKALLFCWVILMSFWVKAEDSNAQILIDADMIRTSMPEESNALLASINSSTLDASQLDLFHYLKAYNSSINGTLDDASEGFMKLATTKTVYVVRQRALASLLTMYTGMKDWQNAIQTADILLSGLDSVLAKKNKDVSENSIFSLAVFYNHIGEHQLAQNFANKLILTTASTRQKCYATSELLSSQIELSPQQLQEEYFLNAIKRCNSINEPILKTLFIGHLAKYFLATSKPDSAIRVLEEHIQKVEASNYNAMIAGYYELMTMAYLALNQDFLAKKYALILIDTQSQHQYKQTVTTAYKVLSELAKKRSDFERAYFYSQKYAQGERLNFNQQNAMLLAIQKAKFNAVGKANQIALLDKQNALLKTRAALDNEAAHNNRLTMAMLGLLIVIIFLWTYKTQRGYLKLRYMAQTDSLTGIANRRYFKQLSDEGISYCKSAEEPLSFIIFDLDFFKKINDKFGHQVGDWALINTCSAAKSVCRNNDIIGRLGGEEFGILLPNCSLKKAMQLAEKCRQAIESLESTGSGEEFKITASFGVADAANCAYDFDKLFAGADAALYRSKDLGRNQVYGYHLD